MVVIAIAVHSIIIVLCSRSCRTGARRSLSTSAKTHITHITSWQQAMAPKLNKAALMIPMVNSLKRLKAYTLSGEQMSLAGLGSEDTFGTFPGCWEVRNLLNTTGWIKVLGCPGNGETPKAGAHYELLDNTWRPKTVLLNCDSGAIVGTPNESISAHGATHLTVLSTEAHIPFEEKPCADVDEVPTPPTPPRPSSIRVSPLLKRQRCEYFDEASNG